MQGGQSGPRSFGQVMDAAFGIYTKRFLPLAKIAAFVWIPLIVALILIDLYRFADIAGNPRYIVGDTIRSLDESRILIGSILLAVLYVIGFLLVVGASLRASSQAYLGEPIDAGASFRFAAKQFPRMFWLAILLTLFTAIAYICLVIPGIYVSIVWILAMPALLLEGRGGFKALGRSNDLVNGFWWRTFGVLLVVGIFTSIVGSVIPGLINGAFDSTSKDNFTLWVVLTDIVSLMGYIFTGPLWAAAITVLYYDLRVRKEGFDLEMLVERIDEPGALGSPTEPQQTQPAFGSSQSPPSAPPSGSSG